MENQRPADMGALRRRVDDEYERLQAALARVPDDRWDEPLLEGGWTVKEDLDHVTFWDSTLLWRFQSPVPLPWPEDLPFGDTAAVNERLREFTRPYPVAAVRERAAHMHGEVVALLKTLPDSLLDEVAPGDAWNRPYWEIIAAETCTHYPEHIQMIERVFPPAC
jgi:DinB family protein